MLLQQEAYQSLDAGKPGIRARLALSGVEDIMFDPPPLPGSMFRPAELG